MTGEIDINISPMMAHLFGYDIFCGYWRYESRQVTSWEAVMDEFCWDFETHFISGGIWLSDLAMGNVFGPVFAWVEWCHGVSASEGLWTGWCSSRDLTSPDTDFGPEMAALFGRAPAFGAGGGEPSSFTGTAPLTVVLCNSIQAVWFQLTGSVILICRL